jgi:hypothetical protein
LEKNSFRAPVFCEDQHRPAGSRELAKHEAIDLLNDTSRDAKVAAHERRDDRPSPLIDWGTLMARTCGFDSLLPKCQHGMRVVATVVKPESCRTSAIPS